MFTGIVRECAPVLEKKIDRRGARFKLESSRVGPSLGVGDSVSVDGVCLTVVEVGPGYFSVEVTPETLKRSTLGQRRPGETVNLEPPARLSDFLGGHLVQGHVDGVGEVLQIVPEGNSRRVWVQAPQEVLRHCIYKGSISVNGVSLTISGLKSNAFEVTLIPHTCEVTGFSRLRPGETVNLEADVVSKYIEKHVERILHQRGQPESSGRFRD